jgi:hypothetical protein
MIWKKWGQGITSPKAVVPTGKFPEFSMASITNIAQVCDLLSPNYSINLSPVVSVLGRYKPRYWRTSGSLDHLRK